MARITARQAFTRARTKRLKTKTTNERNLLQARSRFIQQLSNVAIACNNPEMNEMKHAPSRRSQRQAGASNNKKITDYFSSSKKPDRLISSLIKKNKSPKTTSCIDPNGVEIVTICDSDNEHDSNNNNNNDRCLDNSENQQENYCSDHRHRISSSSHDSSEANQSFAGSPNSSDVKPAIGNLDLSNLGTSFEDLNLKIKVDEDIEIVEMLPPIPLRNHPVYDLDLESV